MEELYRFLLLRSAEELDLESQNDEVVDLSQQSNFQEELQNATKQADRNAAALNFQQGPDFVSSLGDWPLGKALHKIAYKYMGLDPEEEVPVSDLMEKSAALIAETLEEVGLDLNDSNQVRNYLKGFTEGGDWEDSMIRLKDSILAIRESSVHARSILDLVVVFHAMRLIERLLETTDISIKPAAILQATLYLPGAREDEEREELEVLPEKDHVEMVREAQEYKELSLTIEELLSVPSSLLDVVEDSEVIPNNPIGGAATEDDSSETIQFRRQVFLGGRSMERLSNTSLETLQRMQLATGQNNLVEVLGVLRAEQKMLFNKRERSLSRFSNGAKYVQLDMEKGQGVSLRKPGNSSPLVPQTSGDVSPVGVGDLMVVKQKLKRYEGGDVAHIENVLQGEEKLREHRRRHQTEDTFFDEEEFKTEREEETQTTSRFELRTDVQKQVKTDTSIGAGLKVTASYGAVKVTADSKFAYKNAQSESRKRATNVSKEIVEKAATKYTERFKSSKTRKVLDEIEELNRHSIDASNATEHIVGIYQWVNKVYESQVFNYGQRVMYEFMIPEPAAYFIWALNKGANSGKDLKTPPAFSIDANDIDEWNFAELAAIYGAVDMPVPPEPFVTVDSNNSGGPSAEKGPMVGTDRIAIPEGYEYHVHVPDYFYTGVSSDTTRGFDIKVSTSYQTPGTLPIAYRGYSIKTYSYFVHVLCRRTNNAMAKWRMKAWEALHAGHQRQVATYEEKLAALMARTGVKIEGQNPYFNRKIEQRELQKSCLTLLTGTHPSWLNATNETGIGPVPSLVWAKPHGNYVRFMEQAYEWENMSYVLYPYFWARAKNWLSLQAIQDVDPEFQEFLTSGYARVVVPVRPGFESAVEHYRQTGQIWTGGKLPEITDPDYLPIAEEIKARQNAGGTEIPIGEPWEVLLPTQLVKLRSDNALPEWEKQADGSWIEKQNPA